MFRPVPIKDLLQAPNRTYRAEFRQAIASFESLTPVEGEITVCHRGNFLEVSGQARTIVTLECHRCLQTYNHRLEVNAEEILWLREQPTAPPDREIEVDMDDLVESLPPNGTFDLQDWIYQQLCLALPQKQLCDVDCGGVQADSRKVEAVDERWSVLQQLKEQMQ